MCQQEALGSVFSGSSMQALGSLCWALLKPPPFLQPSTSLVLQPGQLHDTNLNSLRFPAPNLHQDHYKLPSQSRSEMLLEAGPWSNTTIQVKMGGCREWLTLSSFALNLTVPSSCHPLWRPYLTRAFPDLHSKICALSSNTCVICLIPLISIEKTTLLTTQL